MITEQSLVIEKRRPFRIGVVKSIDSERVNASVLFDGKEWNESIKLVDIRLYSCDAPQLYTNTGTGGV